MPGPGSSSYSGGGGIGGGGYGGGYYHHHHHGYYDPFWGGCYYWGGNYYFWGGHFYSPFYHRYAYYRDPSYYDYRTVPSENTQSPIFFPPAPPPLGAALPPKPPPFATLRAPETLSSYLYEPFYAPLSTRLAQGDLTKKMTQRLEAYRTTRDRLREELLQRLDSLQNAAPAERISALEAFARQQTPALRKLEADADALRSDLLHGGLIAVFSGSGDWNQRRNWRLGVGQLAGDREKIISAEFRVIRAAVFYQDGLSPEQRRLLREVEMDLQVEAFRPKNAEPISNEALVYFSPEATRIPLPADTPPELSLKLAAYTEEKDALKTALRDAIYTLDPLSDSRRTEALQKLAAEQAPRFATLEALAEEIRLEFERLPNRPGLPTPPDFPPALSARITAYQNEKNALHKALQYRLDALRKSKAQDINIVEKPNTSLEATTLRIEIPDTPASASIASAARELIQSFNRENQKRIAELGKERAAIREEVARFAASQVNADKSVDSLISDFYTNLQQGERWQHYRYYQIAVLQPGLSPEQRRLLLGIGLEHLGLHLPAGEYPP